MARAVELAVLIHDLLYGSGDKTWPGTNQFGGNAAWGRRGYTTDWKAVRERI